MANSEMARAIRRIRSEARKIGVGQTEMVKLAREHVRILIEIREAVKAGRDGHPPR